jgi:S-adenosyl methyltransferase
VTDSSSAPGQQSSPDIDASVPHSARVWNYWLGGKDYFPADQQAGDGHVRRRGA